MGRRILTGRYVPDNRIVTREPAGIYEDPIGEGMALLREEPLSVITITPRLSDEQIAHIVKLWQ